MLTRLEKSFKKAIKEMQHVTTRMRNIYRSRSGVNGCKHNGNGTHALKRTKWHWGLSKGILKALVKKGPAHVTDIVTMLPTYGYKVKNPKKTKIAVFQSLHRLLREHKVNRIGRGEYQQASA